MPAIAHQFEPEHRPAAQDQSDLTDEQHRQIGTRLSLIGSLERMILDYEAAGRTRGEAMKCFLAAHPERSQAGLYRDLRAKKAGNLRGLADGRRLRRRDPVAGEGVPEPQVQRFRSLWLTLHQRSVALCYQIVQGEAVERGERVASYETFRRIANAIPETTRDLYRLGEQEWRRRHAPKIHRDYESIRPGEHWVADFHQWDIFCRRSETDPTIVRPLLSMWLDLRTRCGVGWDIGERECSDAVLLAFRRGVETYGPPQQVTIDNGKPYRAYGVSGGRPNNKRKINDEAYVRSVFAGLNVLVHFSIPYNPDSKPIEGWFGMLEQQFGKTFASYCSGDLKSECFRQAHRLAVEHPEQCPTVADLAERFGLWLAAYHATPHSAPDLHGLSPAQVYGMAPHANSQELTANSSYNLDPIPRAILPDGALDILLMRISQPVKVGQYGVRCNGIEYGMTDPRLQRLHGQEVCLRIDPVDASYVIVCDLQGRPLLRAVNNRLALNEIDQDHVAAGQRAKKRARRLAREIQDGGLRPAMQDVTTAAIAAKHQAAKAMQKLVAATGTDDQVVRPLDLSTISQGIQNRDRQGVAPNSLDVEMSSGLPRRTVRPLRSDFAKAMKAFHRGDLAGRDSEISNLKSEMPPASLADLELDDAESLDEQPAASWSDLADTFDDEGSDSEISILESQIPPSLEGLA